jgi:hypothetical protein
MSTLSQKYYTISLNLHTNTSLTTCLLTQYSKASNLKENFTVIHNRQEEPYELCNSITTVFAENEDMLEDFELRGEVLTLAEGDMRITRILEMNEKLNNVSGDVQRALNDLEERVKREWILSDSSDDDDDL